MKDPDAGPARTTRLDCRTILQAGASALVLQGLLRGLVAPIRYVAELARANTDSERAIRGPIALLVLCCDPFVIALPAAAFATAMRAAILDRKARTSPTNSALQGLRSPRAT
jgi:uncharacterized heparinase superfamily protein